MNKKTENIITVLLMSLLVFGFSFWAWIKPVDEYSESERRPLDSFPKLSISTVLNGEFMEDFEGYALDQFPLRDGFRTIKAVFRYYICNISDNNGLYVEEGQIAKLEYPLDENSVNYAADRFYDLYESYMKDNVNSVTVAVVPDKGYYLGAKHNYPTLNYQKINEILEARLDFAEFCDITDLLNSESYYNTDTHWRQEKLLPVANRLLGVLGATPFNETELTEKTATEEFYGVYYGQGALPLPREDIRYLTCKEIEAMSVFNYETGETAKVYDFNKLMSSDPYEFYLSGAAALLKVENNFAKEERSLIIFRDSFGSSLAPLLMRDYSEIILVDTRYIAPSLLSDYVNFEGADVLFVYSGLILNNSYVIRK